MFCLLTVFNRHWLKPCCVLGVLLFGFSSACSSPADKIQNGDVDDDVSVDTGSQEEFSTGESVDTETVVAVDVGEKPDGSVDNYDYASSDAGRFTETGIWEQEPESCEPPPFPKLFTCEGNPGLWGKALQMALWFFNVNKSGAGVTCEDVQWRGDAHTDDAHIRLVSGAADGVNMSDAYIQKYRNTFDPDGDGEVDLSGGYYDAGDFIKYGITNGYMASTIAWAMYEFPESFEETGLDIEALKQIRWVADYFMKNMFVLDKSVPPEDWEVVGYAHQVGAAPDEMCGWMPPELRLASACSRPGYFATLEQPATDVTATSAAALALVSLVTARDETYSARVLKHAIALYRFAAREPLGIQHTTNGLYASDYAYDDLAWAAVWLYEATDDTAYLDDAVEWLMRIPGFSDACRAAIGEIRIGGEDDACWQEPWTHSWDSLRSGVFVRLAISMRNAAQKGSIEQSEREKLATMSVMFQNIARADSIAWMSPANQSPQGFSRKVNVTWGSGRYNSAGQLVALTYARNFPLDEDVSRELVDWAQNQSLYLLGDNQVNGDPAGKSFMMGFTEITDNYASQPHHAAGHASIFGVPDNPVENRHILWGALVNGPVGDDTHEDRRGDFGSNQVSIDYNAAFVGALAGNYFYRGREEHQCPDPDFPPMEPAIDEFYTMAKVNTATNCRTQLTISMINESIHPPRYNEFLSSRYYFDVSELLATGVDPSSVTASIIYDSGDNILDEDFHTVLKGPFKCEDESSEEARHTWYFVLSYTGQKFWGSPTVQTGSRITQVEIGLPYQEACSWNPGNDWSFEGLNTEENVKTQHITAYGEDRMLLWGKEPPCHDIQHMIKDAAVE